MYGASIAFLLIAAAVGYKVLLRAEELKKDAAGLKNCGRLLGIIIIAGSLISVGCVVYKVHFLKGSGLAGFACPHKAGK